MLALSVLPPPKLRSNVCFHCSDNPSGLMSASHTMDVVTTGFGILPAVRVISWRPRYPRYAWPTLMPSSLFANGPLFESPPKVTFVDRGLELVSRRKPKNQ